MRDPLKYFYFLFMFLLPQLFSMIPRQRIKLDHDWKFYRGDLHFEGPSCNSNRFPNSLTDIGCAGLTRTWPAGTVYGQHWFNTGPGGIDQDYCRNLCCVNDEECSVWQWCPFESLGCGNTSNGTCWIGWGNNATAHCVSQKGWIGGARKVPDLAPTPAPAKTGPASIHFDDSKWENKTLPHDFVVEGIPDMKHGDSSHGYLPKGVGWYRKYFELEKDDKHNNIWLEFDGVYRDAMVWVNGNFVGHHPDGYISFLLNIDTLPGLVFGGQNILAVRVDSRLNQGWFYEGGGIYRHVWLNIASDFHIVPYGVFVPSDVQGNIFDAFHEKGQLASIAEIQPKTELVNSRSISVDFTLSSVVIDENENPIANASTNGQLPSHSNGTVQQTIVIPNAKLWSLDATNMYTLVSTVIINHTTVDRVQTTFGIRKLEFDVSKGLFINDRSVKMRGFCNHQDLGGVGIAVPDRLQSFRVRALKASGTNAWRMSHHPPNPELLDACDKIGMLVMNENRNFGQEVAGSISATELKENLQLMVRRDRNHPSIILWSLCNEIGCMARSEVEDFSKGDLAKITVKRLDSTRPVTAAINFAARDACIGNCLSELMDVEGFNYNWKDWDAYHMNHSSQPLYASEIGRGISARGVYYENKTLGYADVYSAFDVYSTYWNVIDERDFIAGGFYWTGFDYKGEPEYTNNVNSQFGILDIAGFPKDSFYWFQARWTQVPVLHIMPHWNWANSTHATDVIRVWVFSNSVTVELSLNGQSLGKQKIIDFRAEWNVTYIPGMLKAIAYDISGKHIHDTEVKTTGAPFRIELQMKDPQEPSIQADGQDVALITVMIKDENNLWVPTSNNQLDFVVRGSGYLLGVANGDPSDITSDKAQSRRAYHGMARCIIQSSNTPGAIHLLVSSPGLQTGTLTITTIVPSI